MRSDSEKAVVEVLADDFGDLDLCRIGMLGIQQEVPCVRHHCRGHAGQGSFLGSQPRITDSPRQFQVLPPFVPLGRIKRLNGKFLRCSNSEESIRIRNVFTIHIEMDESLYKSGHWRFGKIDYRTSSRMPPGTGSASALTAKIFEITDAPIGFHGDTPLLNRGTATLACQCLTLC